MKEISMKKHLYIDEVLINSYLSQIYKGSLDNIVQSDTYRTISENTQIISDNDLGAGASVGGKLLSAHVDIKSGLNADALRISSSNTDGHSFTKVFDTFSKIDKFLEAVHIKEDNHKVSDFVKIDDNLQLMNLKKLQYLLNDDYIRKETTEDRKTRRTKGKQADKGKNFTMDELMQMLNLYIKVLPSDIIFYNDQFVIPIDEKNLLCDSNFISYNFTNQIKIIGEIVGSVDSVNSLDIQKGPLAGLETTVNGLVKEIIEQLLSINSSIAMIIRPVLIFTESPIQIDSFEEEDY